MLLSDANGRPVTPASATTGVPSAPNATGAVLAISDRPDASSGENPSPSNSAPVMATGAPKPAAPSKNDPKQNATSTNCRRRSPLTRRRLCCSTSNNPRSLVSWYRKITLRMIQPMGSMPYAAPRADACIASDTGMPSAPTATTRAAASPSNAA